MAQRQCRIRNGSATVYKVNALQSHVEFVRAYVKNIINDKSERWKLFFPEIDAVKLLSGSLTTFQKWKNEMLKSEKFRNEWNTSSSRTRVYDNDAEIFFNQIWDDDVEEFNKIREQLTKQKY